MSKIDSTVDVWSAVRVSAPGRINLIGEHTDFNDGFVLPGAIDKYTEVRIKATGSVEHCQIVAHDLQDQFSFSLLQVAPSRKSWHNYILGIVYELQQMGAQLKGFHCEIQGEVPIGSGMSSSASLECALALALNTFFELGYSRNTLIHVAQRAEHNYVGTQCGIMDQYTSMLGRRGQLLLLDCRALRATYIPADFGEYRLLLLNTNVSHDLATSAYNARHAECREAVQLLQKQDASICHLRDVKLGLLRQQRERMPELLFRRSQHVVAENDRVLQAVAALQRKNLIALGKLMYASHRSLQHQFEVSCPELDWLVDQSLSEELVLGSRMMGGGFGGCTINLVHRDVLAAFAEKMQRAYRSHFGLELDVYPVSLEDGARILH